MGFVKLFIKKFIQKYSKNTSVSPLVVQVECHDLENKEKEKGVFLSEADIKNAADYFYKKATLEVKHFAKESQYKNISVEKKNILYYTGRILPYIKK